MHTHRLVLAVAVASLGAVAVQPAVASPTLKKGVYDCESYNFATGGLDYQSSLKLMSGHRYQGAFNRHGAKLIKPSGGTYSVRGSKIKFKGGQFGKTPGKIISEPGRTPFINLTKNGKATGISCYYVAKP